MRSGPKCYQKLISRQKIDLVSIENLFNVPYSFRNVNFFVSFKYISFEYGGCDCESTTYMVRVTSSEVMKIINYNYCTV